VLSSSYACSRAAALAGRPIMAPKHFLYRDIEWRKLWGRWAPCLPLKLPPRQLALAASLVPCASSARPRPTLLRLAGRTM
jgi:hypothetical protein